MAGARPGDNLIYDFPLVLAPLPLSSLLTLIAMVLLSRLLNYANIIVLLLGVGLSFNICFVMNWRTG